MLVVKDACCKPLLDIFPVLFYGVEFWRIRKQAEHFDGVLLDECQHFAGEVPACIIYDNAQFLVMLVQSFEKCEIFLAIYRGTEFGDNLPNTEGTKRVNLLELVEHVLDGWS